MAEEIRFRSENKRKYEESAAVAPPPPRRQTGFSPQIESQPSDSYSAVPPPLDGFQLAKQRAQAIAARLLNEAEAKRPRVDDENRPDYANGRDFVAPDNVDRPYMHHAPQQKAYGHANYSNQAPYPTQTFDSTTRRIEIPNSRVGAVIGRGGETIKYLQSHSGAKIQVTRYEDADPYSQMRTVELTGTAEQIEKAEQLVNEVLRKAEVGSSGASGMQKFGDGLANSEQFIMKVPNNKVGLVIGKGGESIKSMQAKSGARIQVIPLHPPPGDPLAERTVQINGTKEQIESAKELINEIISENRTRNAQGGEYPHRNYQPPNAAPSAWVGPPGTLPAQHYAAYGYYPPVSYAGYPGFWAHQQPPSVTASYPAYGQEDGDESETYDETTAQPVAVGYYYGGYGQYQGYGGHDGTDQDSHYQDQFQDGGGNDDDDGDAGPGTVDSSRT